MRTPDVGHGCSCGLHFLKLVQHRLSGEELTGAASLTVARAGVRSDSLQCCPFALAVADVMAVAGVGAGERLGLETVLRDQLAVVPVHCVARTDVHHRAFYLSRHFYHSIECYRSGQLIEAKSHNDVTSPSVSRPPLRLSPSSSPSRGPGHRETGPPGRLSSLSVTPPHLGPALRRGSMSSGPRGHHVRFPARSADGAAEFKSLHGVHGGAWLQLPPGRQRQRQLSRSFGRPNVPPYVVRSASAAGGAAVMT